MPFASVVEQTAARSVLQRALEGGRVAQAYLFHGPDGVGKRAAALALAQALECENRGRAGFPSGDACGRCLACTKAHRRLHPDIHLYLPHPKVGKGEKDPLPEDYYDRLDRLVADPYRPIGYRRLAKLDGDEVSNKQIEYRVAQVATLQAELRAMPVEGKRVVGIVTDADHMRREAANKLLKTLEEPSPSTVLVLLAQRPEAMLPTVLSRCQRLRFEALSPEAIEADLVRRGVDRAAFLARLADGSLKRALSLVESESLNRSRELATEYVRQAYGGHPSQLGPVVAEIAGLGRERVKELFALLLVWVRDLVHARALGPDAPLVNVDQAEAVHRFVDGLPAAELDGMVDLVEQARGLVERNVRADLVLLALAGALAEAMRGRARRRLFVPLADALA